MIEWPPFTWKDMNMENYNSQIVLDLIAAKSLIENQNDWCHEEYEKGRKRNSDGALNRIYDCKKRDPWIFAAHDTAQGFLNSAAEFIEKKWNTSEKPLSWWVLSWKIDEAYGHKAVMEMYDRAIYEARLATEKTKL